MSDMVKRGEYSRCVTGIEGLDNILGGGIPLSNIVLVAGGCGTGKTTLAFEFLVRGSLMGESGLLISTVEDQDKLVSNIPQFTFFHERMLVKGQVAIIELGAMMETANLSPSKMDEAAIKKLVAAIGKAVVASKVKRLVIDSIDTILAEIKDEPLKAQLLSELSIVLYKNGCTALLITGEETCKSIEGRVADGIIMMGNYDRRGDLLRTMQVGKMKGTSHSRSKYVIDLTPAGVLVTPLLKGGS
jgi:circadian clock protein KaiC